MSRARTGLVDLQNLSDAELDALQEEFARLRAQHEQIIQNNPSAAD
ncbi:MAG: hypothetical protein ACR2H4_15030 [Pyrinomonadaceae bacterium]